MKNIILLCCLFAIASCTKKENVAPNSTAIPTSKLAVEIDTVDLDKSDSVIYSRAPYNDTLFINLTDIGKWLGNTVVLKMPIFRGQIISIIPNNCIPLNYQAIPANITNSTYITLSFTAISWDNSGFFSIDIEYFNAPYGG
jgi:hypothetical protein